MNPIQTILVPLDFSGHSDRALELATELASALAARVQLVHALHLPIDVRVTPELWSKLREAALEGLSAASRRVAAAGVECGTQIADERPSEAIARLARELKADLVVMGSHGRSGLEHALLGSVAERTIRTAPCPVLTVRSDGES